MNHQESSDPFAGSSAFAGSFEGGLAMGAESFDRLGLEPLLVRIKDPFSVSSGDVGGCAIRHPFDPLHCLVLKGNRFTVRSSSVDSGVYDSAILRTAAITSFPF